MNHWMILPVIVPAVVAPLLAMSVRHDIVLARVFSMMSTVALVIIGIASVVITLPGDIYTYALGNWPAPIGIVLVVDRLAALMLLVTAVLGVCVLLYSMNGSDSLGQHFHPLFQFQLMGLNGAFLTGDLFNLFVFFEVLLIASYGLMNHGGGGGRLRAGIQYMTLNLVGSSIFLIALGLIYGIAGTLNLSDLAIKMRDIAAADRALLITGLSLLVVVFGIKSAIFPLQFWLPGTYSKTSGVVAALFSIMTKVGVYWIIRLYWVTRTASQSDEVVWIDQTALIDQAIRWLMPAAAITLLLGMVGVVNARRLSQQAAFAAMASIGTLLIAIAAFTETSLSAALYYILHSTFSVAALFLVVDCVVQRRTVDRESLTTTSSFESMGLWGSLFFIAAIGVVGMPPLSGFLGKLLILDAVRSHSFWYLLWALILSTSLLGIIGFSRSGSFVFWKGHQEALTPSNPPTESVTVSLVAIFSLLFILVSLTIFSGWIVGYLDSVAEQITYSKGYIDAVIKPTVEGEN